MNKKGFTLTELLAVIAILGLIIVMAVPNIIKTFTKAKYNTFLNDIQSVAKTAISQTQADNIRRRGFVTYCRYQGYACDGYEELDLSGNISMDYLITIDKDSGITYFAATNGEFLYVGGESYKVSHAGAAYLQQPTKIERIKMPIYDPSVITIDDIKTVPDIATVNVLNIGEIAQNYKQKTLLAAQQAASGEVPSRHENVFFLDVNLIYKGKKYEAVSSYAASKNVMRFNVYINGQKVASNQVDYYSM